MICIVSIIRYPKYFGWAGLLSMPIFHCILFFNKQYSFYKLMGCGKGGSFSIKPDWNQWSILLVLTENEFKNYKSKFDLNQYLASSFIFRYTKLFKANVKQIFLQPISSHGFWDKKKCFGDNLQSIENNIEGKIAVLTRATIRLSKVKDFWQNVPVVNNAIIKSNGLIESYGIGEVPFLKQATLSIWNSLDDMKKFSYKMQEHREVISKTRKQNWYSEEMFTRFKVIEN